MTDRDELLELITGAVARGWCHPNNAHKEMDVILAMAIADEVHAAVLSKLSEQTPVAWLNHPVIVKNGVLVGLGLAELSFKREAYGYAWTKATPLYAAPVPPKEMK